MYNQNITITVFVTSKSGYSRMSPRILKW